jgi:hypothetical protein
MNGAFQSLTAYFAVLVLGLAIIATLLRWALHPEDERRCLQFLAACVFVASLAFAKGLLLHQLDLLRPDKVDLYIYRIDGIFGFQLSFTLGQFLAAHPVLARLSQLAYVTISCAALATFAAHLWTGSRDSAKVLTAFVLNAYLAVPFYILFPVCGPRFAFTGFPWHHPQHLLAHPIALSAAPNGIPSVHTSTAILVVLYLWRWRLGRVLGLVYLTLIVLSTLGSGEHYLFDLILAVPYAYLIDAISSKLQPVTTRVLKQPEEAQTPLIENA